MSDSQQNLGSPPAGGALHPYVKFLFESDPVLAAIKGDGRGSNTLGDVGPDAVAERCARRSQMLTDAEAVPPPREGTMDWLEHQVLLAELRTEVRRDQDVRMWQRAPYIYPERVGKALSVLMSGGGEGRVTSGEALVGRLREIPHYLHQAGANLTADAPVEWAEMGQSAAAGLGRFVQEPLRRYAESLPSSLATDVVAAADVAQPAIAEFAASVGALADRASGSWACGADHFNFLLRTFHCLPIEAGGLAEMGRQLVETERASLTACAEARDRDTQWHQQIEDIKNSHPEPTALLSVFESAMTESAAHSRAADLLGFPDGEVCAMDWVPEYQREGLPLGCMSTSPPYGAGLRSEFLITPVDPTAPPARQSAHLRDACYAFVASIAGHETYPGHHLQAVHHKRSTARHSVLRYFASPQFTEGWGLYVEDLLEETGFMTDDRVLLFKRRNALWRALRIVIDVGLHTSAMSLTDAVSLLMRQAGMDEHMARGEVNRYMRHDNPTYPSSYALGCRAFHEVRAEWQARVGAQYTHRDFHDRLLSYGSPPVHLVGRMLAHTPALAATSGSGGTVTTS